MGATPGQAVNLQQTHENQPESRVIKNEQVNAIRSC
jgi:hypothetical protein